MKNNKKALSFFLYFCHIWNITVSIIFFGAIISIFGIAWAFFTGIVAILQYGLWHLGFTHFASYNTWILGGILGILVLLLRLAFGRDIVVKEVKKR